MLKYVCDKCKEETLNGFDELTIWCNVKNIKTNILSMDNEVKLMLCPNCMRQMLKRLSNFLESLKNLKPYRNKNTNKEYLYIGTAIDASNNKNMEPMIIYEKEGNLFVRTKTDFYNTFEVVENEKKE